MPAEPLEVWVVDDDRSLRWVLEKTLRQSGMKTRGFERASEFFDAIATVRPDVLITDIRMPGTDGLELMGLVGRDHPDIPVIIMTAHADLDSAVAAYQGGAFEYLPKPFDIDEAIRLVERAARQNARTATSQPVEFPTIIGRAPGMQEVFRAIGRLSNSSMTVLITGESGTGKELVARALHQHSPRAKQAFVALNTSAIASELLESELFGHERGAFTGATERRIGRFEQADSGTLFLDEIGDMSNALQTRLLRVLAEGEFYRVGGQVPVKVDVRVITATHQDLPRLVEQGMFREDLFHRINVIQINTPPLRDRREDIPELLKHYLRQSARELEIEPKVLSASAEAVLSRFDWPGNVRQLVNASRRLTVVAPGKEIRDNDIPVEFGGQQGGDPGVPGWSDDLARWAERQLKEHPGEVLLGRALPAFERALIRAALAAAGGRRLKAAELLGWGRNTLSRKMRILGIED